MLRRHVRHSTTRSFLKRHYVSQPSNPTIKRPTSFSWVSNPMWTSTKWMSSSRNGVLCSASNSATTKITRVKVMGGSNLKRFRPPLSVSKNAKRKVFWVLVTRRLWFTNSFKREDVTYIYWLLAGRDDKRSNIYVKNFTKPIEFDINDESLLKEYTAEKVKEIRSVFETFGTVNSVFVNIDKVRKVPYAFVSFAETENAKKVVEKFSSRAM